MSPDMDRAPPGLPTDVPRIADLPRSGFDAYLRPTRFMDFDHPAVAAFARDAVAGATDARGRAVALYKAVRDGIRYNPYRLVMAERTFTASTVVEDREGFCNPKAVLLCAVARSVGIPSAVAFSRVVNHLMSAKLLAMMDGKDFAIHGYAYLHIDGRWLAASPAFNIELCEKFGTPVLDFDGRSDAMLHGYDSAHRRYMEYKEFLGVYADFPYDLIVGLMRRFYPTLIRKTAEGAFDRRFEDERPLVR